MTRCCIPGCSSGTFKEIKKTREAGLRVKSYFQFPKNENLCKKWKKVIFNSEEVDVSKLRVCELHFIESDVIKYNETLLKDGTLHRIHRQRYLLRKDAVPRMFNKNDIKQSQVPELKNDMGPLLNGYLHNRENVNTSDDSEFQIIDTQATYTEKINIETNLIDDNSKKCSTTIPIIKSVETFKKNVSLVKSVKEVEETSFIPFVHTNLNYDFTPEVNNYDDEIMVEVPQETDSISEVFLTNEICNIESDDFIQSYNFFQLKTDLQNRSLDISSCWSYAFQDNESIAFTYVHPLKLVIQLFCFIDSNMNVKIATSDRRVFVNVDAKFFSSSDFVDYMSKLEKTKCCEGTGIKNTYSKACQGFISTTEEYARSRGYQRCCPCREFRKKVLRMENNPTEIELQMQEQAHKIKLLEFKYAHMQKILLEKRKVP